jgi:hypothetical protein
MTVPTAIRPAADEYLEYYGKYISLVPEDDAIEALERQHAEMMPFLRGLSEAQGALRYAPGKWSIKQVLGHVTDGERVFAYRAMRIARGDQTPLPGFDENDYVKAATFDQQPLAELVDGLDATRRSTLALFRGLDADAWPRRGVANNDTVSARALAYIIAGHARHHLTLIKERYLGTGASSVTKG